MVTFSDLFTKFKASGVYTVYEDKTVQARFEATPILRLVVGYSKVGMFNCPIFIKKGDQATAERLFGKRDKSLEAQKSFFHKSIELSLIEGDVLALNLWALNNEVDLNNEPLNTSDTTEYVAMSADPLDQNGAPVTKLLASFFNKQKFWKLDRNYLLANRKVTDKNKMITFANISQNPATVFVMKSDVKGYDVTIKDWYTKIDKPIPAFCNPSDFVSDYFLDVVVINGNYGPEKWATLAQDPVFGAFFTKSGLKAGKLKEFMSRSDVSVRQTYTGCVIPDFADLSGVSKYLEEIVNSSSSLNGITCAIDRKMLSAYEDGTNEGFMDTVGHRLIDAAITNCEFLSYKFRISNDYVVQKKSTVPNLVIDSTGVSLAYSPKKIRVNITNSNPQFNVIVDTIGEGKTIIKGKPTATGTANGITLPYVMLEVSNLTVTPAYIAFDLISPLKNSETNTSGVFIDIDKNVDTAETLAATSPIAVDDPVAGTNFQFFVDKKDGGPLVKVVDYSYSTGDTKEIVCAGIVAYINANTLQTGLTAAVDTDPTKFVITAPVGSGASGNDYEFVTNLVSGTALFSDSGTLMSGGVTGSYTFVSEMTNDFFKENSANDALIAGINSDVYMKWRGGIINDGDRVQTGSSSYYLKFELIRDVEGIYAGVLVADYRQLLKMSFYSDTNLTIPVTPPAFGSTIYISGVPENGVNNMVIQDTGGSLKTVIEAAQLSETTVRMDIDFESTVKLYDYLVGLDVNDTKILSRIKKITRNIDGGGTIPNVIDVTIEDKIYVFTDGSGSTTTKVMHYKPYHKFASTLAPVYLKGFTASTSSMPDGTEDRLRKILNVITNTNLSIALTDPEMIDFRYIVDTFGNGLEPNSKSQLSMLAKQRQKCLGILNMPSMSEFEESQNPRFTNSPTPVDPLPILDIQYIVDGGNTAENPRFLYTLPEEEQGASFVGFFGPYLKFKEQAQDVIIPPASLVSNNFIRKFNEGNPFKSVAGLRRGVLTAPNLIGVEYNLTQTERGLFEEKGLNPIYQKKSGEIVIAGIETAYQKFSSALNYLTTRDTLITIEIESEKLIEPYIFEDNDDQLKAEVSAVLSNYYTNLRDSIKCIEYFELVFDDKNNPDFLAREGAAIVDTIIQVKDVTRKFINRITITRVNNSVQSGGFVAI